MAHLWNGKNRLCLGLEKDLRRSDFPSQACGRQKSLKFLIVYKDSVYRSSLTFHRRSFAAIERTLKSRGIKFDRLARGKAFDESSYDLVISLGGDGTFLDAARYLDKTPILGVNSAPGHSVGRLCPVSRSNFEKALKNFLEGELRLKRLHRMQVSLEGKRWHQPVLNDVLVCHAVPAAMSRYLLTISGTREDQRSSGLWISTAAGSTGAIKSSGGRELPLFSKCFQYVPRELFEGHGARYRLKGGVLPKNIGLKVVSQMREGRIYLDGARVWLSFKSGAQLNITSSPTALMALFPK